MKDKRVRRAHACKDGRKKERPKRGGQPKTAYNSSSQAPLRFTQIFLRYAAENFWRAATRWLQCLVGIVK
jgi:hypothetical protein